MPNERVICNKADLVAIGDAIRTITGSTATYYVSELASQVAQLSTGGNYSLQSKSITPTKTQQSVIPDSGYYGLSDVTVGAIPENYADISVVTASAGDVLEGKVIIDSNGTNIVGSMLNNSAINKILDATEGNQEYTIPSGYHSGGSTVSIVLEEKSITPTKLEQIIIPAIGNVFSKVLVGAIPDNYIDTSDANATAEEILINKTAYIDGSKITGTMSDNGAITKVLDATTNNQNYIIPAGYHSGSGKVNIALEEKNATPTKSTQTITPTEGRVLSKVLVAAIPDAYQDVTAVTASAADVLTGKNIVSSTGAVVSGSMTNNGAVNTTIDGLSVTSYTIPAGYHSGTGTVSLTSDIETALAAI